MMNDIIFQKIFDEMKPFFYGKWEKIVAYLEYGEESYCIEFYQKLGKEFIKCYDIPDIDEDKLLDTFDDINEFVSPERDKMKEKWTVLTIVVDSEGNMKAEFDYTDFSENAYTYSEEWKQKYLK